MRQRKSFGAATAALALTFAVASCSGSNTTQSDPSPQTNSESPTASNSPSSATKAPSASPTSGSHITYAEYEKNPGKYDSDEVVLHFTAPWCPTCQATNESLQETGVPAGLTVVKVDYDTSQDLKQEYGVTTQHTFVQIDDQGEELTKFTGSITAEDILNNLT
jgi:thioredoxin 1